MATYPPVTNGERDEALARIADRHRDDSRWSEAGSEARDVLVYLRRRHASLPRAIAERDVWDELVLSAWVYWDERRRELELLRRAKSYGLSLTELGRYLGIGTRQGMRDYLDRLDALLHENPTDPAPPPADDPEAIALRNARARDDRRRPPPGVSGSFVGRPRAVRDADVHAQRRARARTRARPDQQEWIAHHRLRIEAVVRELLGQAARVGIEAHESDIDAPATLGDYLTWLAEDLEDGIEPATLRTLGLALGELRTLPRVSDLARNHSVHQALGAADRLRADYAALTAD